MSRCNRESAGLPAAVRRYLTAAAFVVPAALLSVAPTVASAAPRVVESFDAGTWAGWQQGLRRPAIVVFTTTDCAHCPAALAEIERQRRSHTPRAELLVVVMDGESDDASLLQQAHYRSADRLLAFDGPANRLRHSVNPGWIGVTPYVALLAGAAEPKFVMGVPDMAAWASFYASR